MRREFHLFGILSRYLVGEFLRIFLLCLASFVVLYLLVDFFDRFDNFLGQNASVGAMVRYFLFKIPLVVTQVIPVAVLASLLLSFGALSRHREITAMHACGVSKLQIVLPLLATCALISVGTFFWNEGVAPQFNQRVRHINTVEIKGREIQGLLGTSELWSHGDRSFYHVRYFDPRYFVVKDVTRYEVDGEFQLQAVTSIPKAAWDGQTWSYREGVRREILDGGGIESMPLEPGTLELRETPEDLTVAQRSAEEYNFRELWKLIRSLREQGLDVTEYLVDFHLKFAVPFLPFVMALIAIPLGMIQNLRSKSLASNIGLGLVVGFSYWVVLAFAVSLGHSGALPAPVAAWTANTIFTGLGVFFMLGSS